MAQQTIPVNDGYISSHVGTTPSTGPFAVDFPFFSLNDVTVALLADGSLLQTVLIRGADYDLTGVSTDDGSFSSGSVTLYLAVTNTTVIRFRTTPVERISNFPLQGFFSRLSLNAELNKITVWMQELTALLGSTSEASQAHAPLVSPLFVGNPRAPTPLPADNDTSLATTAFVQAALVGVAAAVPPGVVTDYAGATAPTGWLFCQSQTVSRTTYAALFAAIGTTYNVGGEAGTDFRLPDLRGRVTAGLDPGGTAGRLTTAISGIAGQTLGATGGDQRTQLHTHVVSDSGHNHIGPVATARTLSQITPGAFAYLQVASSAFPVALTGDAGTSVGNAVITVSNFGAGGAQNAPPSIVLNKIIKT